MPATCCFRCFSMLYIWMMCVCECMSVHLLMRYGHCWILAPWGVITEEIFWPLSLISVNMERNCRTSVCMSNTQNTHRGLPWLQPGSTWCTSFAACLFQPSPLCAFASVCVCFSYSAASGLSPARSFNSNCRLFVWVCPYKHTISHVLCSQDYSWLWPQFSSGLLPGSLGGPCRQTSVLPESRKIRTTAHRLATTGKL